MWNFNRMQAPRIVQPGRRIGPGIWGLMILLAASWVWFVVSKSDDHMTFELEKCDNQVEDLQDQVSLLEKERETLRLRVAKYERASQIDKTAVKLVRNDLKVLQEQRATLHQEVEFLKSLVSGDITVLQLTDFKLQQLKNRRFRYTMTVSKRAKGRERVQGKLALQVLGKLNGKASKLNMSALGVDPQDMEMGFSFFQRFKGELTLPKGFKPEKLRVKVSPIGKKFKVFEQTFDWKLGG